MSELIGFTIGASVGLAAWWIGLSVYRRRHPNMDAWTEQVRREIKEWERWH
jgi:hypothetical protein